jgi:predicted dehydrogenase
MSQLVVPRAEDTGGAEGAGQPGLPPVGWGVLGATSRVAQLAMLPALAASPKARLVAVASHSDLDGRTFGAERAYDGYEQLLADPEVDAVYLPLPNGLHADWAVTAAEAGKHVLCEKPLACSADEARRMAAAFEQRGLLLAEAYMTPFHPRSTVLEDVMRSGQLGDLRFARSAFNGPLPESDSHRWRPELGGGVLLDLGIYCLAPLLVAAQRLPIEVVGSATVGPTGVDTSFSGWLDFGSDFRAAVECSYEAPEAQVVEVTGTEASVLVHRAFTPGPEDIAVHLRRRDGSIIDVGSRGADPYRGLVDHICTVLQGGDTPRWPVSRSIELLVLIDTLRAAAGRA